MLATLLALLLGGGLTGPNGTYPPDQAHLLGTVPVVPLHWDLPGKDFFLTVTASGRILFQGPVTGNSYDLPVRSGYLVSWNVVPLGQAPQTVPTQTFQYSNQRVFHYQGKPTASTRRLDTPFDGAPGRDGADAPTITVQLQQYAEGVGLQIEGQNFLLLPSTQPILIESVGGDGSGGGRGQPGAAGATTFSHGGGVPYGALDGGPGGNGGRGGDGGHGGLIKLSTRGLSVDAILKLDVRGGRPGLGGPGGPGGAPGYVNQQNDQQNTHHNSQYYGPLVGQPGPPGLAGPPGQPGQPGSIEIQP